jgi:hypothetical protein
MADDGLDSGTSAHLALDLLGHTPLLTCNEDPELVIGRRVVTAVVFVGDARWMVLPTSASMSGMTVASMWPS